MLNSFYSLIRSRLFRMDAEQAHHFSLAVLRLTNRLGMGKLFHPAAVHAPRTVMGLRFDNPVGLAAGLDKDGVCIDALAAFGFGFIEVGTVTPRPQPGNPRPRLFRLPAANALINRLGFNNGGVDALIRNVQASRYKGILGINLGKNADTPIDQAAQDYLYCLERVYPFASYVTVNISSPNTQNLRQLQQADALDALLAALHEKRERLADLHGKRVPLAIKVAPDLTDAEIQSISAALLRHRIDGLIATNTTLSRTAVTGLEHAEQTGGLSGKPLLEASNTVIRKFHQELGNTIPIIGVGGIFSAADARAKLDAGASLVQIYTGLIYRGPTLVHECAQALRR